MGTNKTCCKAKQYSDQMMCGRCGLAWDVNDIGPPKCLTHQQYGLKKCGELRDLIKRKSNC